MESVKRRIVQDTVYNGTIYECERDEMSGRARPTVVTVDNPPGGAASVTFGEAVDEPRTDDAPPPMSAGMAAGIASGSASVATTGGVQPQDAGWYRARPKAQNAQDVMERGLDVTGTGAKGAITEKDLVEALVADDKQKAEAMKAAQDAANGAS